ncbi:hypothetical protein KR044_000793, partial [Drosophila immigrans]
MRRRRLPSVWISTAITLAIAITCGECSSVKGVHMQVSQDKLREGDSYNVTCWFEDFAALPPNCSRLAIDLMGKTVETRPLNATALYHEVLSAKPQHRSHSYSCNCNGRGLASADIQIGVHLNITDFYCRFLFDNRQPLKCYFKAPRFALNVNAETTFQLTARPDRGPHSQFYNCSTNQSDVQCIVPDEEYEKYRSELGFVVLMNDTVDVLNATFKLTQAECAVLPAIGRNFKELNRSSNSFCLMWAENQRVTYMKYKLAFDAQVLPNSSDFKWLVEKRSSLEDQGCLSQLQPHQNYTLSVRRRLNEPRAPWSDPFVYKFSTADARPARPPLVWSNGYDVVNGDLFVYWQQLDESEYFGSNFTYDVSVINSQDNSQVALASVQVKSNMASIRNITTWTSSNRDETTYAITIRSQNNVGVSENSSRILISQLADVKQRQATDLCFDKSKRRLHWKAPEMTQGLIAYTVYSCDWETRQVKKCQDGVSLLAINTHSLNNSYDLGPNDSFLSMRWAVAGNYSSTLAGGLAWCDGPVWCDDKTRGYEGIIALSVLGLFTLYFLIRKCRYMSDIKVDLPPGV